MKNLIIDVTQADIDSAEEHRRNGTLPTMEIPVWRGGKLVCDPFAIALARKYRGLGIRKIVMTDETIKLYQKGD